MRTRGTGFAVPCSVGVGSSPGRRPGRRIRPLDSLFAFRQEVCPEPTGRARRKVYYYSHPWSSSCSGLAVGGDNPWGHSRELTQTTERRAWLKGSSPWLGIPSIHTHGPLCWALDTLSRIVQPPYQCPQSIPFLGHPQGKCPSISRSMTPEGIGLASHTSSPEAAGGPGARCPVCPTLSFPWE